MQATLKGLLAVAFAASLFGQVRAEAPAASDAPAVKTGETVKIGDKVADFTFKDIRYESHQLKDFGDKKAIVLLFTTLDCPVALKYLPRLKEMDEAYREKGVQFVAVNEGPGDDIREIAYQGMKIDAEFPFVKDFDGQVARAVGAKRAGEVVVLDGKGVLRYRGRVDNQFRLGGERATPEREDLKLAIEDLVAGREVATAETPVDGCLISFPKTRTRSTPVTFAEHVAPLLQKHCQDCHHSGAPEAPFGLTSFQDAVDHAEMVAEVVNEQRMPPWYASKEHGEFTNLRGMTAEERALVVDWVASGCQSGDLAKAPAPRTFSDSKWKIGEPDTIIKTRVIKLPATGVIPYKYELLTKHQFKQDTWVQGVQLLPENLKAMHHCNLAFLTPADLANNGKSAGQNFITGQVPGGDPMILDHNVGFLIPAGSTLVLQIHYVPIGEPTTDQISVGLKYAREVINKRLRNTQITDLTFEIPPGAAHHKVSATREFKNDITGYGMFSHMHLRGKDMTFRALYPEGREETLLVIPNYSFNWQHAYRWGLDKQKFPKGTKVEVFAHFDNSSFNPYNPDPTKAVREGQQTFEEMMYGFLFYTEDQENLNLRIDPTNGTVLPDNKSASVN